MHQGAKDLKSAIDDTLEAEFPNVESALKILKNSLENKGKILLCGNGGSASQAQHFAAELVVRFRKNRIALPAISLTTDTSNLTAAANDFGYETVFARQVEALAQPHDCLICLSTSGSSPNILKAADRAKNKGCKIISLTADKESALEKMSDITIKAKTPDTARAQEIHLFIIHHFCEKIEEEYNEGSS